MDLKQHKGDNTSFKTFQRTYLVVYLLAQVSMLTSKLILVVLIFGTVNAYHPAHGKQPHRKVLILGAGLSGIVAGKTLLDKGINDFLILEGQDYIGGRIKQGDIDGFKIEQGANWIHFADDEESTPIWNRKLEQGIRGMWSNYSDLIIRDQDGNDITDRDAYDKLLEVMSHVEDAQETRKQPNIPARLWLSLNGWKPQTPAQYAIEYLEIDFENSKRAELVPFNALFEKGTDFFVTDQRGVWGLYKDLEEELRKKIVLKTTVTGIEYSNKMVKVTASDGEVYTADYALCTFSTGVLGSDMVTFTPPLPKWKQEAILTMPMSVYTKIFLKFPKKFWDDKEFIAYAGQTRSSLSVFQDLQRPGIYPNNSGLLLITVTGDEGRRIEKQSFEDTKAEMFKMLKGVYGQDIPKPTDIFYPRWSLNKFVRGSYAEGVVGMTEKTQKLLTRNLENLYFAGEATSADWYGYMQGSYFTGKRQAKRIAKAIRRRQAEK